MITKPIFIAAVVTALGLSLATLNGEPAAPPFPKLIETLNPDDRMEVFYPCYNEIVRHPRLSPAERLQLEIRFVAIVHQFLRTHKKSAEALPSYPMPPDGSMPGTDPSAIKDPELRKQYEKSIAENNARVEAQNKYVSLEALRKEVVRSSYRAIKNDPANLSAISDAVRRHCKSSEEIKELEELINQEAVRTGAKSPEWPSPAPTK